MRKAKYAPKWFSLEDLLVASCPYNISTTRLKKLLLDNGYLDDRCTYCEQGPIWLDKPLVLQLHHEDGDNKNNVLSNLSILCPNCHAQTSNQGGGNKKARIFGIIVDKD